MYLHVLVWCVYVVLFTCFAVNFLTPWTVAHQAPLSMGFPRKNIGVGCHFPLRGVCVYKWSPGVVHFEGSSQDMVN